MEVETFECSEVSTETPEVTEEAVEILARLGLSGQQSLVVPDSNVRCPYREMTRDEVFVYGVLCPDVVDLTDYDRTPIPLRVLQIADHASGLGIFKKLVVWDRASATVKDPVLVGITQDPTATWRTKEFILARWGDELETFVVLLKRALAVKREQVRTALRTIVAEASAAATIADHISDEGIIAGGPRELPKWYK